MGRLVRLGMYEYVYAPLHMDIPTSQERYVSDARAVYNYVTLNTLLFERDLIKFITSCVESGDDNARDDRTKPNKLKNSKYCRGSKPKQHGQAHWRAISRYYVTHIEPIVATKSKNMVTHVLSADTLDDITPLPIVDMSNLAYDRPVLEFLHDVGYNRYHNNPIQLMRQLSMYMSRCVSDITMANLYVRTYLHSLAKSCKRRSSVHLTLMDRKLPQRSGLCLGPRNCNMRRIMDLYTVHMCPFCHKPVNVAVKKKSSVGGAHKSQIFTDEYTQQPLYCTEKNHLGIIKFPLLTYHNGQVYTNRLTWEINIGFVREFVIMTGYNSDTGACMMITNKMTGRPTYIPLETSMDCLQEADELCLFCK